MDYYDISVEVIGNGIGIIILNRPQRKNAITTRMRCEISICLHEWEKSDDIGVVILTGAESIFSAGYELQEFNQPEKFDQLFESSSRYHRDVWHFPKPIIAAINGPAVGGGFDLATLCDIRLCTDTAFFAHPEIKFGAPPLFTPLRWIVGEGWARDLCLTGRRINVQDAFRIGLVTEVVEQDNLLARAVDIALLILEAPNDTLRFTKKYLTSNNAKGFEESFLIEHDQAFQEVLLNKARMGFK